MKRLKRAFFYFLGFIIVLMIGTEVSLVFFLNGKLTSEIKSLLDEKVESKVEFHELNGSILSDFPNLSVTLDSVRIWEGPYQILESESIKAEFNLIDYFFYNYALDKVEINCTTFHAPIDSLGKKYMVKARAQETQSRKNLSLNIPEIIIRNSQVIVSNDYKKNWLNISIKEGRFQMKTENHRIRFIGDANGALDTIVNRGDTIRGPIPVKASDAVFQIDQKTKVQSFEGVLTLFEIALAAKGTLSKREEGNDVDITLKSQTESFDEYLSLIPHMRVLNYKQTNPNATVKFLLRNTGYISPTNFPEVRMDVDIADAQLSRDSLDHPIRDIHLKGYFVGGGAQGKSNAMYAVEKGSAFYKDNYVIFNGTLGNLVDPHLDVEVKSAVDLAEIQPLFNYHQKTSGKMTIDAMFKGRLSELGEREKNNEVVFKGSLGFSDVSIDFPDSPLLDFKSVNGNAVIRNHILTLNQLSGQYQKSPFSISGKISDYVPLLLSSRDEKSKAQIYLDIGKINFPESESSTNFDLSFFPKNLTLDLHFLTNQLVAGDLSLTAFRLQMLASSESVKINKMDFEFGQGKMDITASAKFEDKRLVDKSLVVNGQFKTLNLDKLQLSSSGEKPQNDFLDSLRFKTSIKAERVIFKKNKFYDLKLDAVLKDNHMNFDRFNFNIPFGRIRNDLVIDKKDSLWSIDGTCQLDLNDTNIDSLKTYLANLLHSEEKDNSASPLNLDYKVDLNVISPQLTYQNLRFDNFNGNYTLRNSGVKIRNTDFEIFEGEFEITGKIEKVTDEHSDVYVKFNADQIHLGKVIGLFEPKDQDLFSEQSFSGLVGVNGRLLIKYDKALNYKEKDMVGNLNIHLEDGELINFKPITQSLKFLKKDVTDKIYLSNEKIEVIFHNDEIVIPRTTFASNLSNIEMIGYYSETFNFGFDMKISLGQLLFQSQKKKKAQINKKNRKVGGLPHFLSARTQDGALKINNIKNKDYSSDMKKLNRRYVLVDSVLNAVREELR